MTRHRRRWLVATFVVAITAIAYVGGILGPIVTGAPAYATAPTGATTG